MKLNKSINTTFALAVFAAFAGVANAATIISTFDSDLEGWTKGPEGAFNYISTGGNPGGYALYSVVGAPSNIIAPDAFLGNLSAYDGGTFSWDGVATDEGSGSVPGSYAYGKVTVTGTAGSATSALIPSADRPTLAGWSSYSHDFTAADFGKTEGEWDAILANVTSITLGGNAYGGSENLGYDNIALNAAVPEPSSTALLGLGGLALILRRRK
jgi:hypothetical protein